MHNLDNGSNTTIKVLNITPKPQPRENRSDIWNPRPNVITFRQYKDQLREELYRVGFKLTNELPDITFVFPVPEKATKKWLKQNLGKPHEQRPDLDNLIKGFIDCIFNKESYFYEFTELTNDSQIHTYGKLNKIWGETGQIIIKEKIPTGENRD